ncbi:MAG: hypothetical protein Q8R60_03535 [Mycobacteriales bacterium]|nr:hypothetical protein [Mycobacteriales bacterium]
MRIAARFCGPPGSANGGVAAGLLTQLTGGDEVTLRRPPPLETDLRVEGHEVYDGEHLVATSALAGVDVTPPDPVDVATARAAGAGFRDGVEHPFPRCFVCGSERDAPDSLGLRPGLLAPDRTAAVWVPQDDSPVMVWAALDCPGGWASGYPARPMVLGRMALDLRALPVAGEEHVVQGWVTGRDGRKTHTGTVLHSPAGEVLAVARATWLTVDVTALG